MRQAQATRTCTSSAPILLVVCLLQSMVALGVDYAQKGDEYVQQEFDAGRFVGSVMVARSNRIVFMKGYGLANREHNIPNAPDTKFRLASLTKQFTAMCILHLQEQGKLSIDDCVCRFVPGCPSNWSGVKIRHLLGHTSGITNFTDFPDYASKMMLSSPPEKTIQRFRDAPLGFEPGKRFAYSNSGYILLGYIVERASGRSYEQYVEETIFKPLGMEGSGYDHFETILPHRAAGYSRRGDTWVNSAYIDMSIPYGAGGLYSTVEDFFRWYQCWRERKILSASSWTEMTTAGEWNYGFGMWISEHFRRTTQKVFEHGGHVSGFATSMKWFPDADLFVAAFANWDSARTGEIAENLAAIMFDMPVTLPKERKATGEQSVPTPPNHRSQWPPRARPLCIPRPLLGATAAEHWAALNTSHQQQLHENIVHSITGLSISHDISRRLSELIPPATIQTKRL